MKKSVLVIFGKKLPVKNRVWWKQFDEVVASLVFKSAITDRELAFVDVDNLIEPGNIYEASALVEELSRLTLGDGSRLTKLITYQGYELWWMHYNSLYSYFCLPYTQYKKLLEYLKNFQAIYFYRPPYKNLFSYYLQAYGCKTGTVRESRLRFPPALPFGIIVQIFITLLCLPVLMVKKCRLLVFIGDKFEKSRDYDFRMKFIYQELRQREIPFVEFIRSLESWPTILRHVFIRKRPVIYSEAVAFTGKFLSLISGGHRRAKRKLEVHSPVSEIDIETRFKFLIATHHLLTIYDDIWSIRIMKWVLIAIGVRAAHITAALERNFHTFLSCKLNSIPTVGILHGMPTRYYNTYDFLPGFDGEKMLSVDKYGLWSEWWREHYVKYRRAYCPEQLYISGPMRPLEKSDEISGIENAHQLGPMRVLFISEQLAVPQEVMPYLKKLLESDNIDLTIKFRPYRDGFEKWLLENQPDLLQVKNLKILRGNIQDAIRDNDIVVGSHSTAVLEALFQHRVPILFKTQKWGDCFELRDYGQNQPFFAENPKELIERIKNARAVSKDDLGKLQERYFGDPYKNGSKWVVDRLEETLLKGCLTK